MGSGGVGKTTLAATLALKAADSGLKVLVLTVDPARRLATLLHLDLNSSEIQRIPGAGKGQGFLEGSILNSKKIFDEFIVRHAQNAAQAKALQNNLLYRQLSTTLSGSQEFTSLEFLLEASQGGRYDLIVLDTPPTQHAIDFLRAPEAISSLFEDSVTKWFMDPDAFKEKSFIGKLFEFGTSRVLRSLEILTGKAFIENLIDFFQNVRSIQGELKKRSDLAADLLKKESTAFVVVTAFDEAKLVEARELKSELSSMQLNLKTVIVNRAFPLLDIEDEKAKPTSPLEEKLALDLKDFQSYYERRYQLFRELKDHLAKEGVPLWRLPDFQMELGEMSDLLKFLEFLDDGSKV